MESFIFDHIFQNLTTVSYLNPSSPLKISPHRSQLCKQICRQAHSKSQGASPFYQVPHTGRCLYSGLWTQDFYLQRTWRQHVGENER